MDSFALEKIKAESYSISKLLITDFRNYKELLLNTENIPVVLTGSNGSGKTNILEAISFLSPGRGLRSIKLDEADRKHYNNVVSLSIDNAKIITDSTATSPWRIAATILCGHEETKIGTGRDATTQSNKRIVKIDEQVIKSQAELTHAFSVMWLTPQMDGIFLASSSERRKFLDRLVYNFNPEHASLVYSYEHSIRERSRLLQENGDKIWLGAIESKIAEKAVAIAIARLDAINIIQDSIDSSDGCFPKANLAITGYVESIVGNAPALETEELIKKKLFESRMEDARTGRTSIGTHRSDLCVTHIEKNMPAGLCSTGEQKALLLSIILAEARAKAMWKNKVPVLLLDEVVAHLDEKRRNALFDEFCMMKAQVWMTGTDESLFFGLQNRAQFLRVNHAQVTSQS